MLRIVTAAEMKAYDKFTMEKIGLPSLLLMERAALESVQVILEEFSPEKVLIAAGNGNNGGDALAVGRILAEKGRQVSFWMPGMDGKLSEETKKQVEILKELGFSIHNHFPKDEYDIVVDGLFGIGLSRELEGIWLDAVMEMNALKEKGTKIVSLDIPSGICADSGKVLGNAVKADVTVTFAFAKAGHCFYPGKEFAGRLFVRSIGIVGEEKTGIKASYLAPEASDIQELLPKRNLAGNKGSFGKVLLFAGSKDMCGAAILCAKAALRAGAGMVKIITCEENRIIIQETLPEAMLYTYGEDFAQEEIEKSIAWADVLIAGPGIGLRDTALQILKLFLLQGEKPFVLDADGINLAAKDAEVQELLKAYQPGKVIMTPHPGEFCRLMKQQMEGYLEEPAKAVLQAAKTYHCVLVGKNATTLTASSESERVYMNLFGNDGMATAGSGDVLTGIIGGLLAQQKDSLKAALSGVYLHAAAGEKAANAKSNYGVTASDMIEFLW